MKERQIPFKRDMVRALLANTKTQTRRLVAMPRSRDSFVLEDRGIGWWPFQSDDGESSLCNDGMEHPYSSPYGQPGDRLWVREAWRAHSTFDHLPPREIPQSHVWYMADDGYKAESRYRHAMFMPRWASRITLEVTGVRVERLQDISEADAIAEGCTQNHNGYFWGGPHAVSGLKQMATAVDAYRDLWESINGVGSWDANPWVWVVEFKRVQP